MLCDNETVDKWSDCISSDCLVNITNHPQMAGCPVIPENKTVKDWGFQHSWQERNLNFSFFIDMACGRNPLISNLDTYIPILKIKQELPELPEFQNYSCFSSFLLYFFYIKVEKIQFCYFNYNFLK